jgi:hypothetical protein
VSHYPQNVHSSRSALALTSIVFGGAVVVMGFLAAVVSRVLPRFAYGYHYSSVLVSTIFQLLGLMSGLVAAAALITGVMALVRDRGAANLGLAAAGTAIGAAVVITTLANLLTPLFYSIL